MDFRNKKLTMDGIVSKRTEIKIGGIYNAEKFKISISGLTYEAEEKKPKTFKKLFFQTLIALTSSALTVFVMLAAAYLLNNGDLTNGKRLNNFNIADEQGIVLGEEDIKNEQPSDENMMASENYQVRKINLGGDVTILRDSSENIPLEVYNVRNELFITKDNKEIKALVYWKTNKLAVSEIEYSEMSGMNPKKISGKDYNVNHSVVLSDLDLATTYTYKVKAKDRWGNEVFSEKFSVYTGSLPTSIFELIEKGFKEIFSWAIKK